MSDTTIEREVAKALLDIQAVGFAPEEPVTFKSGIKSPVYVDNRRFPFHPAAWRIVIDGFKQCIESKGLPCEVVAGVEAAGIPHSAALGFAMNKPSVFVRKQAKDHGTKKMVEGGDVAGQSVILVEDLVSTGGSSLAGVQSLRGEGAVVTDCLVIISYGFAESKTAFAEAGVTLHALSSFPVVLEEAEEQKIITLEAAGRVREWLADPHGWGAKYGFV